MIGSTLLSLATFVYLLLAGAAVAQSFEAARAAQDDGRFMEAARLGEELRTSSGYALAAESLAIYGYHVAKDPEKEALFERAMRLAEEAVRLDPVNSQAHLQSAHAMGRYAQTIGAVKALARGYAEKVRKAIEDALALDPEMAGAHLSLATWHAETIDGAGIAARLVFGASRKRALSHYERALELAPDEKLAYLEYAIGLLLLKKKKDRGKARNLLARAIETPSKDAHDRILHELAVEKLESLGGK
jgi:tetratricopeptide (TPR) repeat protein